MIKFHQLWLAVVLTLFSFPFAAASAASPGTDRSPLDFMTGDECLFCHRGIVGLNWQDNSHNLTVRAVQMTTDRNQSPEGAEFILGAREARHWLKSTKKYGLLAVRTAEGLWDDKKFGTSCAGCHSSGVDPMTGAYAAVSLDCFVCHGDTKLNHSSNPGIVPLSPRREDKAIEIISICGSCHLRGGHSRSTGRPWPKGYLAGEDLLNDYEYDFSNKALRALSLADRHVAQNVKDVAFKGRDKVTCVSCHSIHGMSKQAHKILPKTKLCYSCHIRGKKLSQRHVMTRFNSVCEIK